MTRGTRVLVGGCFYQISRKLRTWCNQAQNPFSTRDMKDVCPDSTSSQRFISFTHKILFFYLKKERVKCPQLHCAKTVHDARKCTLKVFSSSIFSRPDRTWSFLKQSNKYWAHHRDCRWRRFWATDRIYCIFYFLFGDQWSEVASADREFRVCVMLRDRCFCFIPQTACRVWR